MFEHGKWVKDLAPPVLAVEIPSSVNSQRNKHPKRNYSTVYPTQISVLFFKLGN